MLTSKRVLLSILISSLFLTSTTALVFASRDYLPGVTKGQYVKYGNFVGTGPGLEAYNNNDWMKYEATDINNSRVTLLLTGQFKNGTTILGSGEYWTYDITYNSIVNGTPAVYSIIIAGNLNKGDLVAPNIENPFDTVNDTQTRTYIGNSRSVNIIEYTNSSETSTTKLTCIYDKESGMLMEARGETTETQPFTTTKQFSYSVTETNIFSSNKLILGVQAIYFYVLLAVSVIIIVAVLAVVYNRKFAKSRRRQKR
jgi:hypothetical protein